MGKLLMSILTGMILSTLSIEARCLSDVSTYREICQLAAQDDQVFAQFKRNPHYTQILEHLDQELGMKYLEIIQNDYPEIITLCSKFRRNDLLGKPVTYNFGEIGNFSSTTLRYMKVAAELKHIFGDSISQMHIVEIGGGYGGQCKILNDLCGFASYTIIDLPECIALSRKYLNLLKVPNVNFIDNMHLDQAAQYDLVISNYAFSELDRQEQLSYLAKVVLPTPNGYMTMNFTSHLYSQAHDFYSLSMEEMVHLLMTNSRQTSVNDERPLTHPSNQLLLWKPTP